MAAADEYSATLDTAEQGWRDALAAIPKMPIVLGVAVVVILAPRFLPLGPGSIVNATPDQLFWLRAHVYVLQILIFIGQSFLLTPVVIAVHRFVLLGEVTRRYPLDLSRRFWRFFFFSLIFQIVMTVPSWLAWTAVQLGGLENWIALSVIFLASLLVAVIAALQLLLLFPAVAVDAPGADWRNAMTDSKAHTLRIFFVMLVTAIPMIGLQSSLPDFHLYAGPYLRSLVDTIWCFVLNEKNLCSAPNVFSSLTSAIADWAFRIAYAAVEVFALCAFAAVASRLFAAFGNKLKGEGTAEQSFRT